ncbi:inositol-pentakisphosphate 2-kinase [Schizothecium vesticola]|uniref:Inositol-pentakisphosphate 2-kinase n=1 Tax=Schizothecium vesticola TaxID=314040 RepID=A0AA40BQB1_9PEZI|nr:inositol-pentakisphosphate 2-kinase [Schizothecium vesticola]
MNNITSLPPPDQCEITFVGEGAANVVFKVLITTPPSTHDDEVYHKFKDHLLRVPKANTTAYSYHDLQSHWESAIVPRFPPSNLVHQQLLHWTSPHDVISRLNSALASIDDTRRPDFRGSRIAHVTIGMLVADMNQTHLTDTVFEFKPKWLAQSPSAPPTATRCRTCARVAQKQQHKNKSPPPRPSPCPLTLLSHNTTSSPPPSNALLTRLAGDAAPLTPSAARRLAHWLQTNTLLPRLRDLQVEFDPVGPLSVDKDGEGMERLQLAMTLRDCSCYVRIPADGGGEGDGVEARLGDLDRKNGEGKLGYWRETERGLVEGGFTRGRGWGVCWGVKGGWLMDS